MQFIATRAIYKVPKLQNIKLDKELHPNAIHKGAIFSIGDDKAFDSLPRDEKEIVALLVDSHCVGDANDTELVKRINAEVLAEKRREENVERINLAAAKAALGNQLVGLASSANALQVQA